MSDRNVTLAIAAGIERAASMGLTKPYDIAISVKVALDNHGYRVTRKPVSKGAR